MAVGSRARVANPSGAAAARRGCGKGRLGAVSGLPRGARRYRKEAPVQPTPAPRPRGQDVAVTSHSLARLRVSLGGPSGPCKRQSRAQGVRWTPRAAVAQAQHRPALGMAAERSRRGEMAQDDDTGSRCGFSALEAESCLPQIPHWHGNMPPNQRKRKNYYAGNMVPPL